LFILNGLKKKAWEEERKKIKAYGAKINEEIRSKYR
jgi:hypothetical protein